MTDDIPDAVTAVIAAAIREHPTSPPETAAKQAVDALRADGWHISAPDTLKPRTRAVQPARRT